MSAAENLAQLAPEVARHFWGAPNRRLSNGNELRWGTNGSKSLDLKAGVWFDHEQSVGGGCLALIEHETGQAGKDAVQWLVDNDFRVSEAARPAAVTGDNGTDGDRGAPWEARGESLDEADKPGVAGILRIPGFHEVAVFDYRGPDGRLALQVVRFEADDGSGAKTFRQRAPTAAGGWEWSAKGVTHVPYRLAELQEALRDGSTIFVVEGEKCADALWTLGVPPTTNPGGAGKWRESLTPYFQGADVVILVDDDPQARTRDGTLLWHENGLPKIPGWNHSTTVAAALTQVAKRVRLLKLTDRQQKEDVYNWLAAGGTAAELYKLAKAAPIYQPGGNGAHLGSANFIGSHGRARGVAITATPFVWVDPASIPPRQWLFGKHAVRGFISITAGTGGAGKTALILAEVTAYVSGKDLLKDGLSTCGKAWYLGLEDPLVEYQRRLAALCVYYELCRLNLAGGLFLDSGRDQRFIIATEARGALTINVPVLDAIKAEIRKHDIALIVVDPFVHSHTVSESDNTKIAAVAALWANVAEETGCAVELCHHIRKGATGGVADLSADDARGASALVNAARSVRMLAPMTEDQAAQANVEQHRRFFKVLAGAKANLAFPSTEGTWRQLVTVSLGNGGPDNEDDKIGVATPWEFPSSLAGLSVADLLSVQDRVAAQDGWRLDPQSPDWVGFAIAEVVGVDGTDKGVRVRLKKMLATWIRNGALRAVNKKDAKGMTRKFVIVGERAT